MDNEITIDKGNEQLEEHDKGEARLTYVGCATGRNDILREEEKRRGGNIGTAAGQLLSGRILSIEEGKEKPAARCVLIVGAGAAGLAAAISAADCGAKVTVAEHRDEAGIKLSLTGKGRCNYTNTDVGAAKYNYENEAGLKFVEAVLEQFGYEDCISFFRKLGIEPEIRHYSYDESGYVYPRGMSATDFRNAMYRAALKRGVHFRFGMADTEVIELVLKNLAHIRSIEGKAADTGSRLFKGNGADTDIRLFKDKASDTDIRLFKGKGADTGIKLSKGKEADTGIKTFEGSVPDSEIKLCMEPDMQSAKKSDIMSKMEADTFDAVIIATGSNAYPATGSDSSIYPLFKELGIKQERFLPALCALYSKDALLKEMKGRRIKTEARLTICGDKCEPEAEGKIPRVDSKQCILTKDSNECGSLENSGEAVKVRNLKSEIKAEICMDSSNSESDKETEITSYSAAGEIQFNEHSISGIPVMQLSRHAAKALNAGKKVVLGIDGHDYAIHRTAGFDRAQTCTGGIPAGDLDPHTMRHGSGLYFCGEIIDIDGECGGYNLHFAWGTGYLAGRAAAGVAGDHGCPDAVTI